MNYDWNKLHQANRSEGDCQVVSAVNAYYLLTGKHIPHCNPGPREIPPKCDGCKNTIPLETCVRQKLQLCQACHAGCPC